MKTILITIFSLIATMTFAQQSVIWKGGTPGRETNWNEPKNWSTNNIPDEFSDVIINDVSTSTFSAPVINEDTIEVNSIRITFNGQLTTGSKATIIVYGYTDGILTENINIEGTLKVKDQLLNMDSENIVILEKY